MGADPSPLPLPPAAALQEEAAALGKSSFAFAFYMDRQKEERERGVTISCTTKEFFTEKFHYTIIDAPGERCCLGLVLGSIRAEQQQAGRLGVQWKRGMPCKQNARDPNQLCQACSPGLPAPPVPAAPQAIAISSRT